MDVTIRERKMSFGIQYDIDTPSGQWYARKQMWTLTAKVDLFESEGGPVIANLNGEFSPLRHRYEFDLADGRKAEFACTSLLKQVYECKCGSDVLTLYQHHGRNYSVFKGEQQIAAYSKNLVVIGDGNKYEIRMDSDADMALIVSMVLALSVADDNDKNQEGVSIDLGSIGPQARAFDESWEPR